MTDAVINVGGETVEVNIVDGEGPSTYDLWIQQGNTGSLADFFNAMVAELDLTVTGATGQAVTARALMAAIASPVSGQLALLLEEGREGAFVFSTSDLSAEVTADPLQAFYVASSSDTTGASGAWVRRWLGKASVKWWGAKGDGSTDDLPAINAAVAYMTNRGGGCIFFPRGRYKLGSSFNATTNSLITYPQITAMVDEKVHVRIVGEAWDFAGLPHPVQGTVIDATGISGSGTYPSILAPKAYSDTSSDLSSFSAVQPYLENIRFLLSDNPSITGVNFHNVTTAELKNITVSVDSDDDVFAEPTDAQATGVILPGVNNDTQILMANCFIQGLPFGVRASEHAYFQSVQIRKVKTALVAEAGFHNMRGQLLPEQVRTGLKIEGACRLDLMLTYERNDQDAGEWYGSAPGQDIVDPLNLAVGRAIYNLTLSGVGSTTFPLTQTGGTSLKLENLASFYSWSPSNDRGFPLHFDFSTNATQYRIAPDAATFHSQQSSSSDAGAAIALARSSNGGSSFTTVTVPFVVQPGDIVRAVATSVTSFKTTTLNSYSAANTLAWESFSGGAQTLLAHRRVGYGANRAWLAWSGGFKISASKGTGMSATIENMMAIEAAANVTASATFRRSSGSANQSIIVRGSDAQNCWLVNWTSADSTLRIVERNNGVDTIRASGAATWSTATDYVVQAVAIGTTISAKVNAVTIATYGSATFNQTALAVGLRQHGTAADLVTVDDFHVE